MTRILTAFLAWSLTVVAVAQPPVTLGDGFDLAAPSDVTISGRRGVWFPMDQARAMLADVEELDLLRQQLVLTERLVQEHVELELTLGRRVDVLSEAVSLADRARLEAVERAERAEGKLDSVWRHPMLWLAAGFIVASAAAGALFASTR